MDSSFNFSSLLPPSSLLSSLGESECEQQAQQKYKIYGEGESARCEAPHEKIEKVPSDIDGLKHYVVKDKSRLSLLAICMAVRKRKKKSCIKWEGYDSIHYQNCT